MEKDIFVENLFGTEPIDISAIQLKSKTKEAVKKVKDKVKKPLDLSAMSIEQILKSKKVSLLEKLKVINKEVLRVLGKQKANVLVIKDKQALHDYISLAIESGRIAVDTETNNSLDPVTCKLMGPCFYYPGGKQAYVPINHRNPETKERLSWQLTEEDVKVELQRVIDAGTYVIMHNGKFDFEVIKCTCGIDIPPQWDTLVCARLLDENEKASLKELYVKYIDPSQEKYSIDKLFKGVCYADVDPDIFALYAATDSLMTDKIFELQKEKLDRPEYGPHMDLLGTHEIKGLRWLFHEVEMPIVTVTANMELRGVAVDTNYGERLKTKYDNILNNLDTEIAASLDTLKPYVQEWRVSDDANNKTKTYVPAKSKMSPEKIEEQYPLIDENGNRYKVGKTKGEQLDEDINLASPVQLAILFYDILEAPVVNSKKPRATGKSELEALATKLTEFASEATKAAMALEAELKADGYDFDSDEEADEVTEQEDLDADIIRVDEARAKSAKYTTAVELCNLLLKRRKTVKLLTTYIEVIPTLAQHWPDGRIRFHMNSLGTDTGRYSSGGKIKYMENDEAVTVSGINIQNIPAKGDGSYLRMLFKASQIDHQVDLTDNYYEVPETDEVETTNGWKSVTELVVGDKIIGDDNVDVISSITKVDRNYYLYVA